MWRDVPASVDDERDVCRSGAATIQSTSDLENMTGETQLHVQPFRTAVCTGAKVSVEIKLRVMICLTSARFQPAFVYPLFLHFCFRFCLLYIFVCMYFFIDVTIFGE